MIRHFTTSHCTQHFDCVSEGYLSDYGLLAFEVFLKSSHYENLFTRVLHCSMMLPIRDVRVRCTHNFLFNVVDSSIFM